MLKEILRKNAQIGIAITVAFSSYFVGYILDNPIALLILFLYGTFLVYSHFKKRFDLDKLSKTEIFAKIVTILSSLTFLFYSISQINTGEGKHAGILFIVLCIITLLPYIIVVILIDFLKAEVIAINLLMGTFFSLMIISITNPTLGALISLFFPFIIYIAVYSKKSKKMKLITFGIIISYLVLAPYYFIQGTDIGLKLKDPCFKRERYGKGETHFIKGDRVCAFIYDNNSWNGAFYTVKGADAASYESVGTWYTRDKNNVYYGHKKIDADVNTFKYENHIFSDKNGIWKDGVLSTE